MHPRTSPKRPSSDLPRSLSITACARVHGRFTARPVARGTGPSKMCPVGLPSLSWFPIAAIDTRWLGRAFPPSLKADIDAMVKAAISPDLLSPTSRRPIKAVSARSRLTLLRRFSSALVLRGRDPLTLRSIADLVGARDRAAGFAVLSWSGLATDPLPTSTKQPS